MAVEVALERLVPSVIRPIGQLRADERPCVLFEGTLDGVGITAKAKFTGDLAKVADPDEARDVTGKLVQAALDDPGVEVIGKLPGVTDAEVRLHRPGEANLPSTGIAVNDADLIGRMGT